VPALRPPSDVTLIWIGGVDYVAACNTSKRIMVKPLHWRE
jgi:hypothetical protein